MEMFYTEHDFQVDLENLRVQLEISCRENTTLDRETSGDNVKYCHPNILNRTFNASVSGTIWFKKTT